MKETKIFVENFKGHVVIAIWAVDAAGNKTGKFPVISFGARKGEAIVNHIEEIKLIIAKMSVK